MKIKFCGAAQTVTGSQHLFEINGKKILIDCGMFQGKREESYQMNRKFLFEPKELDCVILSHSHIDHSGNLPTLSLKGYEGSVYCTPATRDLCSIMLQDSAYIQEKDTEFVNKRRAKKGEPLFNPLYKIEDAKKIIGQFKSIPYRVKFSPEVLGSDVSITFYDAGHILGSSQVVLEIKEGDKNYKLGFSGDLGRKNLPILKDPDFMGNVDYLIFESTYGARFHEGADKIEEKLTEVIREAVNHNSKIIVPSFSIGRAQEIVYEITKLETKGIIPQIPIFVDSPLTVNATEIFKLHSECFDTETSNLISSGVDVFGMENVKYIKDVQESMKLNNIKGPCMIISASGMCEAGRILHHLRNNIGNSNNIILVVGFMAEHTLGRRIVEAKDVPGTTVKIFGEEHIVRAKVKIINAFSGHADRDEMLEYLSQMDKSKVKKMFLVHGEAEQQLQFKKTLEENGFKNVYIPKRGDVFEL